MKNQPPISLPEQASTYPEFQLGSWTVHPSLNRISGEGGSENLEPRMMHVLVCLASAGGRVVSRRDLLEHVWQDVVVGEEALTRAVSRLRILLGDSTQESRIIETIRGVGYRLLCPVEMMAPASPAPNLPAAERPVSRRRSAVVLSLLLIALVIGTSQVIHKNRRTGTTVSMEAVPFTTYPSYDAYPDFSPDGATVVFSRTGEDGLIPGLFLKQQDVDTPRRLTTSPGTDYHPAFSPDGSQVAFVRRDGEKRFLLTVPVLGGATRRLLEMQAPVFGMAWSPDGQSLVFASDDPRDGVARLRSLHLETLDCTPATQPDISTHTGDSWPAFSPDGRLLAFARCDHAGLRDIWVKSTDGEEETRVTTGLNRIAGQSWLPDNRHLVVAAAPGNRQRLFLVDIRDGSLEELPAGIQGTLFHPVVSPDGGRVVFGAESLDFNIMQVSVADEDGPAGIEPFTRSTRNEYSPVFSPDGQSVAFLSDRSGSLEAWVARADGSGLRRLTDTPGVELDALHWSPDGSYLATTAISSRQSWVLVVEVATGLAHALNDRRNHERSCGWSTDGDFLHIMRDVGTDWQFFRVTKDGQREYPGKLALNGHPRPVSTADGIWFIHPESGGLWRAEADGSSWHLILPPERMRGVTFWRPTSEGLLILRPGPEGGSEILLLDPASHKEKILAGVLEPCHQVAWNPRTGGILVTTLAQVNADLFQIELAGGSTISR